MKAYNVHARLGRCDGFLMLPTALQSQIVEQVQSMLAAPAPASEAVASLKRLIGSAVNYPHTERSQKWFAEVCAKIDALAGDSADAPVQQAGSVPMARIEKLAADIQRAGGAERSLSLVSAFLRDCAHAALKGEQPVEPSGSERGEV